MFNGMLVHSSGLSVQVGPWVKGGCRRHRDPARFDRLCIHSFFARELATLRPEVLAKTLSKRTGDRIIIPTLLLTTRLKRSPEIARSRLCASNLLPYVSQNVVLVLQLGGGPPKVGRLKSQKVTSIQVALQKLNHSPLPLRQGTPCFEARRRTARPGEVEPVHRGNCQVDTALPPSRGATAKPMENLREWQRNGPDRW